VTASCCDARCYNWFVILGLGGKPHEATHVHHATRQRGGCVAARGAAFIDWLAFKGFIVHFSIIPRGRSPGPLVISMGRGQAELATRNPRPAASRHLIYVCTSCKFPQNSILDVLCPACQSSEAWIFGRSIVTPTWRFGINPVAVVSDVLPQSALCETDRITEG